MKTVVLVKLIVLMVFVVLIYVDCQSSNDLKALFKPLNLSFTDAAELTDADYYMAEHGS
ncbi:MULTISPECIES: hypothetical protein [unclassified Agarivorans]|uniref:hypothetical protein n=1 Tax=unclassified Agarivorans TaxID=2636026 RepID=UPI003D7D9A43